MDLSSLNSSTPVEAWAREYIEEGFSPVPIPAGRKGPELRGWPSLRIGMENVSTHFNGKPQNIGILVGEPSSWRVDVDLDVREAQEAADSFLPRTLTSGRRSAPDSHWWYIAAGAETKKWMGTGGEVLLELRSTGNQTVVEPSVHPSGEHYEWNRKGVEIAEVDTHELVTRCTELATATLIARHLPEKGRHDYAMALAGYLLKPDRLSEEITIRILLAAWHAGGGASKEADADLRGIVESTARKITAKEKVTGGPHVENVVPGLIRRFAEWWGWNVESEGADTVSNKAGKSMPTHDELRDRWLTKYPDTAYGLGGWQRYASGIWNPVHDLCIRKEISGVLEEAKPEGINPTSAMVTSVESLSRAEAMIPDETWDSNDDILVCANGTLDISSGGLREHRPADYAKSAVAYDYDPNATAPTWLQYLESTVPEAAGFLQEFAGYCLTPDTSHELAVWLYGPPGCGKSTFIEGLTAMMGARAGVLGLADVQHNRFALGNLPGKTLLHAAEQPSDYLRSSHLLNSIISGEPITVEQKFKDPYTVTPRAKVCWAMNDLPRVGEANSGLFRRVKVVAFPKLLTEPDPRIKQHIKREGAGILAWALEGLYRLRERGTFEIPESIQSATNNFKQSNDVPGLFVSEACIIDDEKRVQSQRLYDAYKAWCHRNGHKPLSVTSVSSEWLRLGYEKE